MDRKFDDASRESNPPPRFGEALPIGASPQTLAFLAHRRSASAMTLGAPAPTGDETDTLLTIAARVPDHGKLAPWRFVILQGDAKARFVRRLEILTADRTDGQKLFAKLGKLRTPPLTIVAVSRHLEGDIPEWEQRLSAGAVCMALVVAAQAMGYGANWITDWYAYDDAALSLLSLAPGERVAGFVHIGTATEPPLERVRPNVAAITTIWEG